MKRRNNKITVKKFLMHIPSCHISFVYWSKILVSSSIEHTSGIIKKPSNSSYQIFCIPCIYQNKYNLIRHFQSRSNFVVILVYRAYTKHTPNHIPNWKLKKSYTHSHTKLNFKKQKFWGPYGVFLCYRSNIKITNYIIF